MKFNAPLTASFLAALATSVHAGSSPFNVFMGRAATDPAFLTPTNGTVFVPGTLANTTWSTAGFNPPTCGQNINDGLFLGKGDAVPDDGSPGSLSNPLAANFSITVGLVYFMVPDVAFGDDYFLSLKADTSDPTDSGSRSDNFTIQG